MNIVTRAVHGSSVADVAWLDADGMLHGCGALALLWKKKPVLAFSYAYEDLARRIASAHQVALVMTETRSTSSAFAPAALIGRPTLIEDIDGYLFTDHLLSQELRRYPPARIYADSLVLRREYWWYLPRLIVSLDIDTTLPMPARSVPPTSAGTGRSVADDATPLFREHLLAVAVDGRIETHLVRAPDAGAAKTIALKPVDDRALPSGPAVLLGQYASFPDLARWSTWRYQGFCRGDQFEVTEPPSSIGLESVPSVWQRLNSQRAFGRDCRAGIARSERIQPPQ
jgi:hypothetical protein